MVGVFYGPAKLYIHVDKIELGIGALLTPTTLRENDFPVKCATGVNSSGLTVDVLLYF